MSSDLKRRRVDRCCLWLLALCGFVIGCGPSSKPPSVSVVSGQLGDPVFLMRSAINARDWKLADQYSSAALLAQPDNADTLTDTAKVFAFNGRQREAAFLLVEAAELTKFLPPSRVDFAVHALIDVGELYAAIDLLEKSLSAHPENVTQRRTLLGFLGEAQRHDLIPPHFLQMIRARNFDFPILVTLTETSSRQFSLETLDTILSRNANDLRVRLGQAYHLFDENNFDAAGVLLNEILANHPDFSPAFVLYGQVLIEQRKFGELPVWLASAPPGSPSFALYWLCLGDWAAERKQLAEAARGYWEACRIDPNLSAAWIRLSKSLRSLRNANENTSSAISDAQLDSIDWRTAELLELRKRFYDFSAGKRQRQSDATDVARALMNLGRNWEAEAWSAAATTLTDAPAADLQSLRQTILNHLKRDTSWQSKTEQVAIAIDLSSLPLPDFDSSTGKVTARIALAPAVPSTEHLRLTEESDRWGLGNVGAKNNPKDSRATPLIRSTGVGGGAIDYDLDGNPDVVVMGAGGTMLKQDSMPNELLRNLGDRLVNATTAAAVVDKGFGQGVAVGDFNEDGFPDLFFANLGLNRLFRNNGDGTFIDCSNQISTANQENFTTCGAFVDFNEDGNTDLIVTNYCEVSPALGEPCNDAHGNPGTCLPISFLAKADQCFLATGDGRLTDVSAQWMSQKSPGRGLGILAGALDGKQLGIYIANDMSANFYYTRSPDGMSLIDSATATGLAVDGHSNAQASMGIASSDFDGDGDLDIYVTGFAHEYNIYYEQIAPNLWADETGRTDLINPTLPMVGFGTQAIDLDNDGIDEIIVANGHVGEFANDPTPFEQPLQLFRRQASGQYHAVEDDSWGDYFSSTHAGRAVWTMDLNRDGRLDVLITHMYEAVRLLVNHGEDSNNKIAFQLVGTKSSRDATGAVLRFDCNGRKRTLWCLSGDGYFCSNERLLRAGLGTGQKIENLTVTWQDGSVDIIGSLTANAEYVIVQGMATAYQRATIVSPFALQSETLNR